MFNCLTRKYKQVRFIWPSLWPLHGNSISLKIMTLAVSYHAIETHCLSLYLSLLSSSWSKGPKEAGNRTLEQRYVVGGESVRVWRQEIGNWWKYDYWNRISCLEFIMWNARSVSSLTRFPVLLIMRKGELPKLSHSYWAGSETHIITVEIIILKFFFFFRLFFDTM